jgi:hypothetical protein
MSKLKNTITVSDEIKNRLTYIKIDYSNKSQNQKVCYDLILDYLCDCYEILSEIEKSNKINEKEYPIIGITTMSKAKLLERLKLVK